MIRGCVGFSYISGRLFGDMLLVRGKRVISVPLPIGVYHIMNRLSRRKNILGKILFKNSTDFKGILESKKD
jgi:hypothetical protein